MVSYRGMDMPSKSLSNVIQHLHRTALGRDGVGMTDRAMAEEAITGMVGLKLKLVLMVMVFGLAVGGAGWAGYGGLGEHSQAGQAKAEANDQAGGPAKKERPVAADQYGDP